MSARPVCLFIPRGLCAGLARRQLDRTPDSLLTVSTAVCLYQRHSKSFRRTRSARCCIVNYVAELRALITSRYIFTHYSRTPRAFVFINYGTRLFGPRLDVKYLVSSLPLVLHSLRRSIFELALLLLQVPIKFYKI